MLCMVVADQEGLRLRTKRLAPLQGVKGRRHRLADRALTTDKQGSNVENDFAGDRIAEGPLEQ